MKVLLTLPFGSRLYGTFDENSDWDWKKVILPSLEDLLIGTPIKNQFFSSSADTVKNTSEDTDTEIVPIQTFAKDVLDGQTYALEILFATMQEGKVPLMQVHDRRFVDFCKRLWERFLTSNINAMVGYAYHQAELYSEKGNRLDKLHQFKQMLQDATFHYGLTADDKLGKIIHGDKVIYSYHKMEDKMFYVAQSPNPDGSFQVCFSLLEKLYPENITIAEAMKRVDTNISKYGRRANQAMDNKGKDWKAISHAVRVTQEALDVLQNQWIDLPFSPSRVAYLKEVKYGNVAWEDVQTQLVANIDEITELQGRSKMQQNSPKLHEEFRQWLKNEMVYFYGVAVEDE